ncbi:MAG: hypothetical protein FWE94_07875 [Coriobacteriia bacterium]|nr:hypothetical protein [Coriobacteriia bacterium]
MTITKTIAVAYASIGSGHRIAAEALATEIRSREATNVDTRLLDIQDYSSGGISGNRLSMTFGGPTAGLYNVLWKSDLACSAIRVLGDPITSASFSAFERALADLEPDVVVCTHALASVLALRARQKASERNERGTGGRGDAHGGGRGTGRGGYKIINVATDLAVHGYWPRQGIDLFCVANEPSKDSLIERGMLADKVAITGIPIRQQFTLDYSRNTVRTHFELPANHRVVLVLAGSTMPGPYRRFKEAVAVSLPALAALAETTVVVVCGKDDAFAKEMRARTEGLGTINARILGFVEHMAPLMACADIALAKPGGSICAESLASGLPLVLVGPAVGQENANANALVAAGAALFATAPSMITAYARKAMSSTARLNTMRERATMTARPFAASSIADFALALAEHRSTAKPASRDPGHSGLEPGGSAGALKEILLKESQTPES